MQSPVVSSKTRDFSDNESLGQQYGQPCAPEELPALCFAGNVQGAGRVGLGRGGQGREGGLPLHAHFYGILRPLTCKVTA